MPSANGLVGSIDTPGEFLIWVSDDGPGMPGLNDNDEVLLSLLLENEAFDLNKGTFSSGTGLRFVERATRQLGGIATATLNEIGGATVSLKFEKRPSS